MTWQAGEQLQGGKYTIERELGRGRFGITYLAKDLNGDRLVIKTLNDDLLNTLSPEERNRLESLFLDEAVKLAKCRHPHIVQVEKTFKEGSRSCIAMEYVDGNPLSLRAQKILPELAALRYIRQIGEALIEVHDNQLIHRDIRPENIMLRVRENKPEAVLIDFGLALDFDHTLTTVRTKENSEGFTPLELYSKNGQPIGAYTDIYSLAATLYELLTGTIPVSAIKRRFDKARLKNSKKLNPQISDRTNRQILAGMRLDPKKRPQSVRKWLDGLELSSVDTDTPNISPTKQDQKINWSVVWTAAGVIVTLVVGIPAWIAIFKPSVHDNSTPTTPSPLFTQKP